MPVNSIWEGSGNIMCLDVLRVLTKQHGVYDVLSEALRKSKVRIAITTARYVSYSNVYANRTKQWAERLRSSFSCWGAGGNAASCLAAAGASVVSDDAGYTRRNAAACPVQNDLLLRATGDCGNVWPVVHAIRREPRGIRHRVSPVRASYPTVVLHTFE